MIKITHKEKEEYSKLKWQDIKIGEFFKGNLDSNLRQKVSENGYLIYFNSANSSGATVGIRKEVDFLAVGNPYKIDVEIIEL